MFVGKKFNSISKTRLAAAAAAAAIKMKTLTPKSLKKKTVLNDDGQNVYLNLISFDFFFFFCCKFIRIYSNFKKNHTEKPIKKYFKLITIYDGRLNKIYQNNQ